MSLHRLDVCTLTITTAWDKYLELREVDKLSAILALAKHFERVDEKARAKQCAAFFRRNELDHTAKGKVR